jgi:hypothetical protein
MLVHQPDQSLVAQFLLLLLFHENVLGLLCRICESIASFVCRDLRTLSSRDLLDAGRFASRRLEGLKSMNYCQLSTGILRGVAFDPNGVDPVRCISSLPTTHSMHHVLHAHFRPIYLAA